MECHGIRIHPGLTKMQKEFESYIFIASSIPSMVIVVIHAFVGNRFSVRARSVLSLAGIIVTFSGVIGPRKLDHIIHIIYHK